ncbi:MAG: hypothetical protein KIG16_01805 [Eubacteriales bacterium]|nr:hypothetical protein [Eubacteriales bacterium]
MTKQERAEQAELADKLAEEIEEEEAKEQELEQDEEAEEDADAEEDETTDEAPEDAVDYDDHDEITEILNGIDFDITGCNTQDTITTKILYLCNQENRVLDKFKENDSVLNTVVYNELYQTIVDSFNNYLTILRERLKLIVKSENLKCAMNRLKFIVGDLRRDKINNKYQVKLLRYKNWLYWWKKWREHNILRKQERERYKAEIKALKALSKTTQSEPP